MIRFNDNHGNRIHLNKALVYAQCNSKRAITTINLRKIPKLKGIELTPSGEYNVLAAGIPQTEYKVKKVSPPSACCRVVIIKFYIINWFRSSKIICRTNCWVN